MARIHDTETGDQIWFGLFLLMLADRALALTLSFFRSVLVDGTAGSSIIFDVCFSPDGKLLATAADDKVVRVSSTTFVLVIATAVIIISEPNAQHRTTFDAPRFGISPRGES